MMRAKRISISIEGAKLAGARRIAKRDGTSLSAVFLRGLDRELEAEERRAALEELVRESPNVSVERKREIRATWRQGG